MKNEAGFADHPLSKPMPHSDIVRQAHQLADHMVEPGVCYFVGGDHGPVKIGYSTDLQSRLRNLQLSSPLRLSVLATSAGGEMREAAYHYQFAAHRLHGEWFERCPEIEAEIARLNELHHQDRRV